MTPTKTSTEESGARVVARAAGEVVFAEGDLGTEMFIVQEGSVEIFKVLGGKERRLALLEKGDFFGEMGLLEEQARNASARAVEDAKLVVVNASTFDRMLRRNPEIAVRIMRKLSRRVREADRLLHEVAGDSPPVPKAAAAAVELTQTLGPARLVHGTTGREFLLSPITPILLGRRDPVTGIEPDIDLTDLDTKRSCSRRHARIYPENGEFFLVEEIGTANGTFLDGERVVAGAPVAIPSGGQIRLGLVEFTFREKPE